MNRHVGASFTLSVLMVGFFAIVLYQPDRLPPTAQTPGPVATASDKPPAPPPSAPPEPTPGVPHAEAAPAPADVVTPGPSSPGASEAIPTAAAPRIRPVSRTRMVSAPRGAFTLVGDGETLDDVALRVYGTTDKRQWLWQANRDLLDRQDTPLVAGIILRTP